MAGLKLRALAQNLCLSAASIAACLIAGELLLRVLARHAKGGKEQQERQRYTLSDPVLGWRKTPGAQVVYDRRDFHSEFRINPKGLRGPERGFQKPSGVARVLALGDSFTEAFMVNDESMLTTQLESKLTARGCRVEVINGGTVGYSTDQQYLFYRHDGRRYASDVVIVFLYHNDLPYLPVERYSGLNKPRLDFETEPPTVANLPVPAQDPGPERPLAPPPPLRGSHLLEFAKERLETGAPRSYARLAGLGLLEPLRLLPMNDELWLYHVPKMRHTWPYWSALTYTLQALSREVARDGARLLVAYIPSRMEIDRRDWDRTWLRHGVVASEFLAEAPGDEVRLTLQRIGVPFLDLRPSLRAANGTLTPVFYRTDSHWNAHGQKVAAAATADALGSRGLLPGCGAGRR